MKTLAPLVKIIPHLLISSRARALSTFGANRVLLSVICIILLGCVLYILSCNSKCCEGWQKLVLDPPVPAWHSYTGPSPALWYCQSVFSRGGGGR